MVQTYIVGTVLFGWVQELNAAIATDNIVWILNNDHRIIATWYSTSATYIFSTVHTAPRGWGVNDVVVHKTWHCVVFVSVVQQYSSVWTVEEFTVLVRYRLVRLCRHHFLRIVSSRCLYC